MIGKQPTKEGSSPVSSPIRLAFTTVTDMTAAAGKAFEPVNPSTQSRSCDKRWIQLTLEYQFNGPMPVEGKVSVPVPTATDVWFEIEEPLKKWVNRRWFDYEKAKDVLQAGFSGFLKKWPKYGYDSSTPTSYKVEVARCCIIDAARSLGLGYYCSKDATKIEFVDASAMNELPTEDEAEKREKEDRKDKLDAAFEACARFDPQLLEAVHLMKLGKTQAYAAEKVGMKRTTLNNRLKALGRKVLSENPEWAGGACKAKTRKMVKNRSGSFGHHDAAVGGGSSCDGLRS